MPPPTTACLSGEHYVFRPSVRLSVHPAVNTYFARRDISVLSGSIAMKLATNIHHVSGNN